jgi:glycosyltransferase involved in cell wall biosynthesis
MAGKTVTFLRDKNDEEIAHYFRTSEAFVFPNMDDFGIVAVEALAAGTPVIAYKAGGALDYIEDGKNGLFFDKQDVESLKKVMQNFSPSNFNHERIQQSAAKFSIEEFHNKFRQFISQKALSG